MTMTLKRILSENDIAYLEERFREVFATKEDFEKYRSDLMEKLDQILKEILVSREEQTILAHHSSDHSDRIESLEKIHPAGVHISS